MRPPPLPEPASQRLVGAVLIMLAALAVISLFKQLGQRPPGKSRIDWPPPASPQP